MEETKNSVQLSLALLKKDSLKTAGAHKTETKGSPLSSPSSPVLIPSLIPSHTPSSLSLNSSNAVLNPIDTHLDQTAVELAGIESADIEPANMEPADIGLAKIGKPVTASKANDQRHVNKSRPSLWYAIYFPQLNTLNDLQQSQALTTLASKAQSVSSTVSFHKLALVCEIRSSINYFGGIDSLHDKLKEALNSALIAMDQPEQFFYAASPTVSGSLLLARAGQNTLVYQKNNLRSSLGTLSTDVLNLSKEQNRRLYNMGIRSLKDIWRLPTDGIRKRFGSEFVNLLNKALGKAQEPTLNYLPPPTFSNSYDLPYELENLDRLLPIVDEIIGQLCDFLTRRDLSTSHLVFSLFHEKRSPTCVEISLRQASRSSTHFLLLIETYFHNLAIPAAVISVSLDVKQFDAFISHTDALLLDGRPDTASRESSLNQFMEQLKARLGDNYLKSIYCAAQHRPEYASASLDFDGQSNTNSLRKNTQNKVAIRPRPIWLLEEPEELVEKNGRLYHRKAISIISGPERIETAWWADHDVRRDYYIAQEGSGSRLWIYRERSGERRWLLHGYFS